MRILRKILKWLVIVVLLLCLAIFLSGKTYLFKAVANTYLKGRSGPSINEYKIFSYHTIATSKPMDWPSAKDYNQYKLSAEQRAGIEKYQTIAFLVLKNDSVKYEEYWDGFSDTSHTNSFSMAKNFQWVHPHF